MVALLANKNVVQCMVKMTQRYGAKLTAIEHLADEGQLAHYRFKYERPAAGGAAAQTCAYEFLLHRHRGPNDPRLLYIRASKTAH
jgi:hypothetical protein